MRIKTLKIKNFRSFGPNLTTIDLSHNKGYFVVAGLNAVGKSNLLDAIRWVTLQKNIGGDTIERWDFHKGDTEKAIELEAELDPPIKQGDTFNKFSDVVILRLEAKEYLIGDEKGSIRCDHPALRCDGQSIMTDMTTKLAKERQLSEEEKAGRQSPRPLMVRDISRKIPIYYLDNASYAYHLTMKTGSLMSWLSKILRSDLLRDSNKVSWRGKDCTRDEAIKCLLSELGELLKTDRVEDILNMMSEFMTSQLRLPADALSLEIGLPGGADLIRKLDLLGKDSGDLPSLPFDRLGRGYSALGIVALFRALNNLADDATGKIMLIEEPEIFLGPHLRALFAATLQEFASKGNQVIVVTHSAEFFDPSIPEAAVLIKKENSQSICVQWSSNTSTPSFDINLKHIEPNLDEILFSQRVLFVEGDDDYAAVHAALELKGVDPSYYGLEILRLGGNGNIKHLAPYAKKFRITHAALLDADAKTVLSEVDSTGQMWRVLNPDLEGSLNTTKQSSNKSEHIVRVVKSHKTWENLKKSCPYFVTTLEEILGILGV